MIIFRLSRFADKLFSVIIIFVVGVSMVTVMVHDKCSVFDESKIPLGFDEKHNLCLDMLTFVFKRLIMIFNKLICHWLYYLILYIIFFPIHYILLGSPQDFVHRVRLTSRLNDQCLCSLVQIFDHLVRFV
jgi:hypothetical protein